MSDPTAPRPRGPSPRVLAALVLALLTGVGVLGGVALDRFVLLPRAHGGLGGRPPRGAADLLHDPGPEREAAMRRAFGGRLARDLDLTPEQRRRVDSLLARQAGEWQSLRDDVRPRLRRIFSSFRAGMDTILTPEQRERFRAVRRRHRGAES